VEKIEKYIAGMSFEDFTSDLKTQDAVVRNLSIIGEAVNNISDEAKARNPEIPWNEIVGMRNKVIHEYFGVDEEILWKTVREDLPSFKKQLSEFRR
jgi:uncharacterized protein with HEPN domain